MPHRLRAVLRRTPDDRWLALDVRFSDQLHGQARDAIQHASTLPAVWFETRYETDADLICWAEAGSRERLKTVLKGCLLHGWPFVVYVRARQQDNWTRWLTDYTDTYVGWWPNRLAFAQEVAASSAHFLDDLSDLDDTTVDAICSGFLCLEVDGQALVFDLVRDD